MCTSYKIVFATRVLVFAGRGTHCRGSEEVMYLGELMVM